MEVYGATRYDSESFSTRFAKLTASHMPSTWNIPPNELSVCVCVQFWTSAAHVQRGGSVRSLSSQPGPLCAGESQIKRLATLLRMGGDQLDLSLIQRAALTIEVTHTHKQADLSREPTRNICKRSQLFHKTIASHAEGSIWSLVNDSVFAQRGELVCAFWANRRYSHMACFIVSPRFASM